MNEVNDDPVVVQDTANSDNTGRPLSQRSEVQTTWMTLGVNMRGNPLGAIKRRARGQYSARRRVVGTELELRRKLVLVLVLVLEQGPSG